MASTPSASALSAVLRCQRNIIARKQANKKRPSASVYGLGKTYGASCNLPHGESVKSYFRAPFGFKFEFYRERVEIPGVLTVTARLETSCSKKSQKSTSTAKTDDSESRKMINVMALQAKQTKLKSVCYNCKRYSPLTKNNTLLFQMDNALLRKLNSQHPWTLCICILCAQNSALNQNAKDLFSLDLLSLLKNRLIYFTTAVSGIVRGKLALNCKNQFHPDCDNLSGCGKCTSEHQEKDESKTLKRELSKPNA